MDGAKVSEKDFELRSEKVRSVIGSVPGRLLRFGTLAITATLVLLFLLVWFLPYKRSYKGVGTLVGEQAIASSSPDSIELTLKIRFIGDRPHCDLQRAALVLQQGDATYTGQLEALSALRDTLGRQTAQCRVTQDAYRRLLYYETDVTLIEQSRLRTLIWR